MGYSNDHQLASLFSLHRFDKLPSGAAREKLSADVRRHLELWLGRLRGPHSDPAPDWGPSYQEIVDDWLKVPLICIEALHFRSVRDKVLDRVVKPERETYKRDLPALAARWICGDAERAWRSRKVRECLRPVQHAGASVRFTLLLSFVPVWIFETLRFREGLQERRHRTAEIRRRYANPRTRLHSDDDRAQPFIALRSRGFVSGTDEDIKQIVRGAYGGLSPTTEQAIFEALALDKAAHAPTSSQGVWNLIVLPLLNYLDPFIKGRRKSAAEPRVTSDELFAVVSQLLSLRAPGVWAEKPGRGRLKSRFNYYSP